jgi:hypothetical protein
VRITGGSGGTWIARSRRRPAVRLALAMMAPRRGGGARAGRGDGHVLEFDTDRGPECGKGDAVSVADQRPGRSGQMTDLNVSLNGFNHAHPRDVYRKLYRGAQPSSASSDASSTIGRSSRSASVAGIEFGCTPTLRSSPSSPARSHAREQFRSRLSRPASPADADRSVGLPISLRSTGSGLRPASHRPRASRSGGSMRRTRTPSRSRTVPIPIPCSVKASFASRFAGAS